VSRSFEGEAFSPGIGIGTASVLPELVFETSSDTVGDDEVEDELATFHEALEKARADTDQIRRRTGDQLYEQLVELFSVQEMMLEDPLFVEGVESAIKESNLRAESAVMQTLETIRGDFQERFSDDAMQGRMIDLVDVGWRVLQHLDTSVMSPGLPHGGILIARDLAPSMAVMLEDSDIDALVTTNVDQSSHTAVVAQALELPAVGIREERFFEEVEPGEDVIVAANRDRVIVDPSEEELERYENARERFYQFTHRIRDEADQIDDESLPCAIRGNIGLLSEIPFMKKHGGHGAGLVRTELLFMGQRDDYPGEETQKEVYDRLASSVAPYMATIRTFDVGGDKEAFQHAPEEPGKRGRGIHRSLREGETFATQLRALVETYQEHENLKILIPMVGGPGEIRAVRDMLEQIADSRNADLPPLGVMIEVPSSVFYLPEITDVVDFLSIGTNDLTHYLVGVDRFEQGGVDFVETPSPALFRCISRINEVAAPANCTVSVCGELAGNPAFTPVLLGLGVNELSMSPIRIPEVKLVARDVSPDRADELAERVLTLDERNEMKEWVREELGPIVENLLNLEDVDPSGRKYHY
jgi:phosphotransferase system enzyme I (PtsI)